MDESNHHAPASEGESRHSDLVAIVGMGCRWPGGVCSPSQLWDLLAQGKSGYQDISDARFHLPGFYHPNPHRPGSVPTRGAYLLQEDAKLFDHAFFGITPTETATLDPSHRKLLEVVYEAFESAGEPWDKFSGSRTGVFIGNFTADHNLMQSRDPDNPLPYATTGGSTSILSNRVNYVFNLQGPSLTIDTACSSSLYALHLALNSIRNGDCDAAIVGAGNLVGPDLHLLLSKLGALSPTSNCHAFDAAADGYARGEGFAAFYLKRASDAVAGAYPIRAVIRGTAVNSNGRTAGITHPSQESQEAVIRAAYANAGLDPSDTGYFEAHGTGTQVGDPTEVSAIGRAFSTATDGRPLGIGSIKSNIGHTEAASGLAGLMKAVLALEASAIPPTINITEPNPRINFSAAHVRPVTRFEPWPADRLHRASINSFGYGGANAHCVVDEVSVALPGYFRGGSRRPQHTQTPDRPTHGALANGAFTKGTLANGTPSNGALPNGAHTIGALTNGCHTNETLTDATLANGVLRNGKGLNGTLTNGILTNRDLLHKFTLPMTPSRYRPRLLRQNPASSPETRRLVLLPFSAHETSALERNMTALIDAMSEYQLADVAYTLTARRSKFRHRTFRLIEPRHPFKKGYGNTSSPCKMVNALGCNIGFVFTGQGAQWDGMGEHLLEYGVFRNSIAYQDMILSRLSYRPSWTIHEIISARVPGRLHEPLISQTVCTALQVALVDLLSSWGVHAVATAGHSSGEIAAAYAAGFITAAEAITAAYCRGLAVAGNKRSGIMLAVGLGYDDIEPYLEDFRFGVKVAAINSPQSVTLSGDTPSIMEIFDTLQCQGVFCRFLQTGRNAYHSHHMIAVGQQYEEILSKSMDELKNQGLIKSEDCYRKLGWFSSTTPDKSLSRTTVGPQYWRKNLQLPVLFSRAITDMLTSTEHRVDVLVEIGPHPALKTPLRQISTALGKDMPDFYFPTLKREEDGMRNILTLCGQLFCMNAPIDLTRVNAVDLMDEKGPCYLHGSVCIDLPRYSYSYGPIIYHENRIYREFRLRKHLRHDILGARQAGHAKFRPAWRNVLRLRDVPWFSHHKLLPQTVFPAAGYICMAIEAANQFFAESSRNAIPLGFTIRNLSLTSAMAIPDNDTGVEVLLDLEAPKKGKPSYAFRISSVAVGSDAWTEHCSGIVVPLTVKHDVEPMRDSMDARVVSAQGWYSKFKDVGLGYGPSFQGLSAIRADPLKHLARASVPLDTTSALFHGPESPYFVHPATLDMCAQLALIAAHGGQVERMSTAYVPSFVGELTLWIPEDQTEPCAFAIAKGERHGLRGAHASVQLKNKNGEILVDIADIRCTAYSKAERSETDASTGGAPYMRLVWKPLLGRMGKQEAQALFPPTAITPSIETMFGDIDRLGMLMVADIADRYGSRRDDGGVSEHHRKFLAWTLRAASRELLDSHEASSLLASARYQEIQDLCTRLNDVVEVSISKRILDHLDEILCGSLSGLQLVRQNDSHSEIYNSGLGMAAAYLQFERIVELLAHENPGMRILEIGAGTGGATRVALAKLDSKSHHRRYRTYTFTDVSSGYFVEARAEFASCHGMDFRVLDIEQEPTSQGFEPVYDLVIASCSLHVTSDVDAALRNARSLLKPGGKLLLLECTQPKLMHGLVLGTLPDYWIGTEQIRVDSPFLPAEEWDRLFLGTGFSGIEVDLGDYPSPCTMISTFLTTAVNTPAPSLPCPEFKVFLANLSRHQGPKVEALCNVIRDRGAEITDISADEICSIPYQSRVIVVSTDIETMYRNQKIFEDVKRVLIQSRSVLWLSLRTDDDASAAHHGLIDGLLRVLSAEQVSIVYASISLDQGDLENSTLMQRIAQLEQDLQKDHGESVHDSEFRVIDGVLHVSRLIPDSALNECRKAAASTDKQLLPIGDQRPLGACFETPGILSSLYFEEDEAFWTPVKDDDIEIRTAAVGLNWKDLAVSAGRLDLDNFSSECAGIVTKCGNAVQGFKIGDKVYGVSKGRFGNYMRLHSGLAQFMATDNFAEAAAVPIVCMTALYAFSYLSRLAKGEKVLIQSATGGVGVAAIHLAQQIGADIYATVGTEERNTFLQEKYGIPDSHIFISKTPLRGASMIKATGGRGFDVILSTAAGEGLEETLRCLAPGGRFIDIGRVDVQNHGSMLLEIFKRNATFSSFDLGVLIEDNPALCGRLLREVQEMLADGRLPYIAPLTTFDCSQLSSALLYLSKGTHIGKVVVTYENPGALVSMVPPPARVLFDCDANYVLAGGFGGLGRSILSWMAERGGRNFVVLSRSSRPNAGAESLLADMALRGCSVRHLQCDITRKADVESAISQVSAWGPIKGIIHTAVSLEDKLFGSLSFSEWQRGLAVKVDGTMNLHSASLQLPLDHFLLVSSISAQVALPTQATYCASNNFQNAFARYRRGLKLPAASVELGLIEEVGELGQNPVYHNATLRNGLYHTSEFEFRHHLEYAFSVPTGRVQEREWLRYDGDADAHLITSLDPAILVQEEEAHATSSIVKPRWQSDARFSHVVQEMENLVAADGKATLPATMVESRAPEASALAQLDALLTSEKIEEAISTVTKDIIARMADMLFISASGIEPSKGVAAYGMDSLIAAELRNWFSGTYKCTISFLKLLDSATSIGDLAAIVVGERVEALK